MDGANFVLADNPRRRIGQLSDFPREKRREIGLLSPQLCTGRSMTNTIRVCSYPLPGQGCPSLRGPCKKPRTAVKLAHCIITALRRPYATWVLWSRHAHGLRCDSFEADYRNFCYGGWFAATDEICLEFEPHRVGLVQG